MGLTVIENPGGKTVVDTEHIKIANDNLTAIFPGIDINSGAFVKVSAVYKTGGEYRDSNTGARRVRATAVIPVTVNIDGQEMLRELPVYINATVDSLRGEYTKLDLQHGNKFTLALMFNKARGGGFSYVAGMKSDTGVAVVGFAATIKYSDLSTIRQADRPRKIRASQRSETLSAFLENLVSL